jgi:hypothetical protein
MTIIVFRDGVLAADRMTCQEDYYTGDVTKIFNIGPFLIGGCGYVHDIQQFKAWVEAGRPEDAKPKMGDNFGGMVCSKSGEGYLVERYGDELIGFTLDKFDYVVDGSGMSIALGALACGATAGDAVLAAIKHDPFCGGGVDSIGFD